MVRKIIKIDSEKCNGCGACAEACHEGAIAMVGGKAVLAREDYCDGLGDCLPACPTGAISFEMREAAEYNEAAVKESKTTHGCPGCTGMRVERFERGASQRATLSKLPSRLAQWPCQIKLVPPNAPYFDGSDLLIAADCTAYAYGNFHDDFMKGRITIVGCPKLDSVDYAEKLYSIISANDIKSVTLLRMEVPCCSGLEMAAKRALNASGKNIPLRVVTITTDGKIRE